MKTLYVSDLDGTLLRQNETTSDYTNQTINRLVEAGMLFSYATARSFHTSHKVTEGMNARIPLVVYNGAMVVDSTDGSILLSNFFGPEAQDLLDDLTEHDIWPIIYAIMEDGKESFSLDIKRSSRAELEFNATRRGDRRERHADGRKELGEGNIFYFTCIDDADKLRPMYEKYKEVFHCVFQLDMYSGEPWLEIMPKTTSKANAIRRLKEHLGCDRLVVFGDGKNDVDMFELADEAYAVENAVDELKAAATAIIPSNEEDGVARWLEEHWNPDE